jgi:hypothetical protein
MPEAIDVIVKHVRVRQLRSDGMSDASGAGNHMPLFNVEDLCVTMLSDGNTTNLQAVVVEQCSDPSTHTFW